MATVYPMSAIARDQGTQRILDDNDGVEDGIDAFPFDQ